MLSTVGGCSVWASNAAGPPSRRATAAMVGRERCIRTRRRRVRRLPREPARSGLGLGAGQRPESQPLTIRRDVHLDLVAAAEIAHEDPLAQRVLDVPLNRPLERPGPVVLVVPLLD